MLSSFKIVFLGAIALLAALWFCCDADIALVLAPSPPANAFEGKVIWITGASSGIGASLTKDLVRAGAKVVISARRASMLEDLVWECRGLGKFGPISMPLDVLDLKKQEEVIANIYAMVGQIDMVVLNAGRSQRSLAVDTDISVTRDLMELNYISAVNIVRLTLPHMLRRKEGYYVVVSSLSGKFGVPISSSYSASKFALQGYFDSLRGEVSSEGIHVSTVCPGPVESEIGDHAHRDPSLPKQDEGTKMPTERATALMTKGMYYKFDEMWITQQPILLVSYLAVYAPWVGRQLLKYVLGPSRVKALQSGEGSTYDFKTMLGLGGNKK